MTLKFRPKRLVVSIVLILTYKVSLSKSLQGEDIWSKSSVVSVCSKDSKSMFTWSYDPFGK